MTIADAAVAAMRRLDLRFLRDEDGQALVVPVPLDGEGMHLVVIDL